MTTAPSSSESSSTGDSDTGPLGTTGGADPQGDDTETTTGWQASSTTGESTSTASTSGGTGDTDTTGGTTGDTETTGSTGEAESSSSSGGPDLPDAMPPDWSVTFEDFDGYAVAPLGDGTIVVGGREGDIGMLYILDATGDVLSTHPVDPLQWELPLENEAVTGLGLLASGSLAVLVSRGLATDLETLDGVFEFDPATGEVGWSVVLESDVLQDQPDFFEQASPGRTDQLVTTDEGDLYLAGHGFTVQTSTDSPTQDWSFFWIQRLDPSTGARQWIYRRPFTPGGDVVYRMLINDPLDRVLIQANDTNTSSGNCFWWELSPQTGAWIDTDFSIGTGFEYCWPGDSLTDGNVAAPAGIYTDGANDIHVGGPGGFEAFPLASTHFADATKLYVGGDDAVYVEGAVEDFDADALGRIDLGTPPTSELLLAWPAAGYGVPSPIRAVVFPTGGVLVLRATDDGTALEYRTTE